MTLNPGAAAEIAFALFARNAARRHVMPPLILSVAVSTAAVATFLSAHGEIPPFADRFIGNEFSRVMAILFLAAVFYGALQFAGLALDRKRLRSLERPADGGCWFAVFAGRPSHRPSLDADWARAMPDAAENVADRFRYQLERYSDNGLLPLRFAVWVLPLLGFIGTVVGVARAIVGLETVIATGSRSTDGLLTVLGGLQFAFDTTLLGLAAVIPVMLMQMFLESRGSDVAEEGYRGVLAFFAQATPPSEGRSAAARR